MKQCSKCALFKEPKHFYKRGDKKGSGLQSHCKACVLDARKQIPKNVIKLKNKKWRKKYPDKKRDNNLRYKFGITLDDYNKMFNDQEGKCVICLKHQSELKIALAVDHCHKTGVIRGLLCSPCNLFLGKMNDCTDTLERAISYLNKDRKVYHR